MPQMYGRAKAARKLTLVSVLAWRLPSGVLRAFWAKKLRRTVSLWQD